MSVKISNLFDNSNIHRVDSKGSFVVLEHKKDLSTNYINAQAEYFASQMGIHKRQLICQLADSGVTVQAGAMQWMSGSVNSTTGIKGASDSMYGKANPEVTDAISAPKSSSELKYGLGHKNLTTRLSGLYTFSEGQLNP